MLHFLLILGDRKFEFIFEFALKDTIEAKNFLKSFNWLSYACFDAVKMQKNLSIALPNTKYGKEKIHIIFNKK